MAWEYTTDPFADRQSASATIVRAISVVAGLVAIGVVAFLFLRPESEAVPQIIRDSSLRMVSQQGSGAATVAEPTAEGNYTDQVITFLSAAELGGVVARDSEVQFLINGQLYGPGEILSADLGIKLVELKPDNSLLFEDREGQQYERGL